MYVCALRKKNSTSHFATIGVCYRLHVRQSLKQEPRKANSKNDIRKTVVKCK